MADLLDVLGNALSGDALRRLGPALGIDADDAAKLVKAVVPVLVERLRDNATSGDAENIAKAVAKDHDGSVLDLAGSFLGGGFRQGPGMAILNHVFGDELDGAVGTVARTTGIPEGVVKLGFSALAPLALGAITKAAIGAVTAVVVVKLLDVAVDGVRSGKVQRVIGSLNERFDADRDGNAADDVARRTWSAVRRGGATAAAVSKRAVADERVKRVARQTASTGAKGIAAGAKALGKQAGKLFRRFRR